MKKPLKLVTYKEAITILNEAHGNDPLVNGNIYSIKTIYNAVYGGRLTPHGPNHKRKVDRDELLRLFGPKPA